jgi:hypothetical protein
MNADALARYSQTDQDILQRDYIINDTNGVTVTTKCPSFSG